MTAQQLAFPKDRVSENKICEPCIKDHRTTTNAIGNQMARQSLYKMGRLATGSVQWNDATWRPPRCPVPHPAAAALAPAPPRGPAPACPRAAAATCPSPLGPASAPAQSARAVTRSSPRAAPGPPEGDWRKTRCRRVEIKGSSQCAKTTKSRLCLPSRTETMFIPALELFLPQ